MTAYSDFSEKIGIKSGIILANKGFQQSQAVKCFERNPGLLNMNPVRRNSTLARTHDMYSYEGVIKSHPEITYRKWKVDGKERRLSFFCDYVRASKGEKGLPFKVRRRLQRLGVKG